MYVIDAQMHLLILPSLHIAPYYASNQYEYIYIYREREREREREMSSSYIWCNSTNVTPFLDCKFLKNLMFKKKIIKYDCFHLIT